MILSKQTVIPVPGQVHGLLECEGEDMGEQRLRDCLEALHAAAGITTLIVHLPTPPYPPPIPPCNVLQKYGPTPLGQ